MSIYQRLKELKKYKTFGFWELDIFLGYVKSKDYLTNLLKVKHTFVL